MRYRRFAVLSVAVALLALAPPGAATADGEGVGVALPDELVPQAPTSSLVFTGIRPGTLILPAGDDIRDLPSRGGCTANFVFQETDTGGFDPSQTLYLGAAGHCFEPNQIVQAVAIAPGTGVPVLVTIGQVDFHLHTRGTTEDFALIRINDSLKSWVSPSMAHWGGPTGVHPEGAGGVVTYTGHGLGVGPGGTPRAGQLRSFSSTAYQMTGVTNGGDSGAPVTTLRGLAVGHNIGLDGFEEWVPQTGPRGTSIHRMLALSGKALATCKQEMPTPWPLPGCPPETS